MLKFSMISRDVSGRRLSRGRVSLKSSMHTRKSCVAGFAWDVTLISFQQIRLLYVNFAMVHYPAADEASQLG
jgi:glutamate dehydrogenase